MSLLQKASIITTPTAYAEDFLYNIKPAGGLGDELVTNGTFDTDSNWTKGAGTTISGGKANFSSATGVSLYQNIGTQSSIVQVTFFVTDYTSGTLNVYSGGNQSVSTINVTANAIGQYTAYVDRSGGNNNIIFGSSNSFTGSIDNVSVKEVVDFDFDRNSTGTRVNEDYLIEDVPYNLLSYSNGFNNWSNSGTITRTGGQAGLYNTFDAWLITKGSGGAFIRQSNAQAGTRTFSVYAKADTATFLLLDIDGSPDAFQYYDLSNGVLGATGTNANAEIKHCGNGWYRCSVTGNDTYTEVRIYPAEGNNSVGATNTQLFLQNAQMVKGDKPKDYLKTTDRLDIPRIDYTNGEPSILLEPQRQNFITYSQDYSQWSNQTTPTVTSNFGISPEGITNADKITASSNTSAKYIGFTLATSTVHTGSVFLKNIDSTQSRVEVFASSYAYPVIEISWNGYIPSTLSSANATNIQYQEYTNNWWRVSYQFTTDSSITSYNTYIYPDRVNASKSILAFGSQLEAGSYATSLIHTSGSAVTRSADAANNAGNSDLISSTEGVLYTELKILANDGTFRVITLNDGTQNNVIEYRYRQVDNQIQFLVRDGGSVTVNSLILFTNLLEHNKIAFQYKANDFKIFANGREIGTDTSGTVPSGLNQLDFDFAGSSNFYGNVKSLMVFKEALTDLELEKLTGYNNHELYMNYYNRLSYLGLVEEYNVESDINNYIL
jgi:hypothetical protein